jgi:hypothetical protein
MPRSALQQNYCLVCARNEKRTRAASLRLTATHAGIDAGYANNTALACAMLSCLGISIAFNEAKPGLSERCAAHHMI